MNLRILLYVIAFWVNLMSLNNAYAQKSSKPISKHDRQIAENYRKQANAKDIIEFLKGEEFKTIPSVQVLLKKTTLYDSLLEISKIQWGEGKVFYSPDSTFKIFQVDDRPSKSGCNYRTRSFLHLRSGKIFYSNEHDELMGLLLDPILSIFKLDAKTYGIIQDYEGCGAGHSHEIRVTQMKIVNDSFLYLPIKFEGAKPLDFDRYRNHKGTFEIWSIFYNYQTKSTYLKYNRAKREIAYSYVVSNSDPRFGKLVSELKPPEHQLLQVIGRLRFINGRLSFESEQCKFIKDFSEQNSR